jgi:hypothetical protein
MDTQKRFWKLTGMIHAWHNLASSVPHEWAFFFGSILLSMITTFATLIFWKKIK